MSPLAGTFRASKEPNAWLLGGAIGDAKEIFRFRMLYARLEANAFPSQFIDSDLHDGVTNRKGFVWDLSKEVLDQTTATFTAFLSDSINDSGAYKNSIAGSERFRFQGNVELKF